MWDPFPLEYYGRRRMPSTGSPGPDSSVQGFHLALTVSLGSTRGLCSLGRSQKSSWSVTTSNQMCLLTQGPSGHPGADLGGHLEKRAMVLAVQCRHLSWLLMDQQGSPHYGAPWPTGRGNFSVQSPPAHSSHVAKVLASLGRQWFICGRTRFW